jgi:hypothetical protein
METTSTTAPAPGGALGSGPDSAPLLEALAISRRHVLSERTNTVTQVMATVSEHVCYMMPDVTDPAAPMVVMTDREEVRAFYAKERGFMEVVSSTLLAELTSDWFTFLEAVSTTRQVATKTLHQNEVVVLFPVAPDGIVGEILAARRTWVDVYAGRNGRAPASAPDGNVAAWRSRLLASHERFVGGLRDDDPEAAASAFSPDAALAVVDPSQPPVHAFTGSGRQAAAARAALVSSALDEREVTVLNRVVGEWYVFAEWLVRGVAREGRLHGAQAGSRVELRCASIFPADDEGLLRAEHGFSLLRPLA